MAENRDGPTWQDLYAIEVRLSEEFRHELSRREESLRREWQSAMVQVVGGGQGPQNIWQFLQQNSVLGLMLAVAGIVLLNAAGIDISALLGHR